MECVAAKQQNQKVYPLQVFTETNILTASSCIVLEHITNYQNLPLCHGFLMNE
jgi:hypothetical protein